MKTVADLARAALDEFAQANYLPGAVVVVVLPDPGVPNRPSVHVLPYGYADVQAAGAVDADTVFEIGSLSKLFTGALLASVMTSHPGLTLNRPLQDFTDVRIPTGTSSGITIRDLATHRAGLPKVPSGLPSDSVGRASYSTDDLWSDLHHTRLLFDPGTVWQYSNFGFGLLGTVLTEVTGRTYADLLAERITGPLSMSATGLEPHPAPPSLGRVLQRWRGRADDHRTVAPTNVAVGYLNGSTSARPLVAPTWNNTGALAGSGGVVSTGNDMGVFTAASLGYVENDVQAILAQTQQEVPVPRAVDGHPMGFAWQIRTSPQHPRPFVFKNGGTRGMHSAIALDRDATPHGGVGVAILTNGHFAIDGVVIRLLREARQIALAS